ncbi:MAG: 16S rRNA (guanine(966)-N(2))-methyltransferase RsmD [Gammaproteobacteria bacterium]|nr:16S rRNA (guanine(966)-N(2))-methyltransferase RsmD [Gammaproteobacteria bacterium]
MTKRQQHSKRTERGTVRIIGGQWRGRKLQVAAVEGLRPSSDRARETLFNWLQPWLADAVCLDLFAGSGALGFEALSRGAASAVMLEQAPIVVATLQRQQQLLQADTVQIMQADALSWLRDTEVAEEFDLVFVDPPWQLQCQQQVLASLRQRGWLSTAALVYVELPAKVDLQIDAQHWSTLKQKTIGEAQLLLLQAKKNVILL